MTAREIIIQDAATLPGAYLWTLVAFFAFCLLMAAVEHFNRKE
jgi:hypothetical protein